MLARVEGLFDECVAEADVAGTLWGIGVGVPARSSSSRAGRSRRRSCRGGTATPCERFADRGVPVWVDNDVNVMALGELTAGCGRGVDDFVFVKIGTGIGAGMVDGRIHRGAKGSAGDVGHIHVQAGREVTCRCGMSGCLEAYAGGGALARDAEAAARGAQRDPARLDEKGFLDAADVAVASSTATPSRSS